jgi:hypothetical protein
MGENAHVIPKERKNGKKYEGKLGKKVVAVILIITVSDAESN